MILAALCFVWAGMILGISFLETPVKFTAPSVTLAIGLDVGRHVFAAFNKVEIIAALLACALIVVARAGRAVSVPLAVVFASVALQVVWLRPLLDARVTLILSGQAPPPTLHHFGYIALELVKLTCLPAAGAACLRDMKRAAPVAAMN